MNEGEPKIDTQEEIEAEYEKLSSSIFAFITKVISSNPEYYKNDPIISRLDTLYHEIEEELDREEITTSEATQKLKEIEVELKQFLN